MSRFTMIAGAAAILALGGWYLTTPASNSTSGAQADLAERLVGAAVAQEAEVDTSTIQEMSIGNPDAPVTVIEYASYTCPHCASFHEGNFKKLKADYIDTGKINFIYREVYFDRYGLWASAIARCAGPERFFGVSDVLYQQQSVWARAGGGDPAAIVEELRKIGRLSGLDNATLEACLQDGQKLRTLVAWFQQNSDEHGITSTPSFVINGQTYGNMAYSEMQNLLDAAAEG